jgi:hypothetical protein
MDLLEGKSFGGPKKFTLAGEGEMPKTFLAPGMIPRGKEVH